MSDILVFIYLAFFVVGIVLVFYSPVMLYMFIINKKQRKYIGMIAKKYNLEFIPGKKQIVRDFPLAKGYYNSRWTYVEATSSGQLYQNTRTGKMNFRSPHINIGVGVADVNFTELSVNTIKDVKKIKIFRLLISILILKLKYRLNNIKRCFSTMM